MELATTQSVLMQIQPTIQRFARMLASVLQLEVEIVDENLCRVAGTGAYGKFLGRQLIYANFLIMFAIYPPFLFRNFWRIRGQEITSVKYLRP